MIAIEEDYKIKHVVDHYCTLYSDILSCIRKYLIYKYKVQILTKEKNIFRMVKGSTKTILFFNFYGF